jgi:hypothetical protein
MIKDLAALSYPPFNPAHLLRIDKASLETCDLRPKQSPQLNAVASFSEVLHSQFNLHLFLQLNGF